jgi:hypothetical protein
MKRSIKTNDQPSAAPINGRAMLDVRYPPTTSAFASTPRSASLPEISLRTLAVDSATPSINPNSAGPDPKTAVRKIGNNGVIISLAASLSSDTKPRITTVRGRKRIRSVKK